MLLSKTENPYWPYKSERIYIDEPQTVAEYQVAVDLATQKGCEVLFKTTKTNAELREFIRSIPDGKGCSFSKKTPASETVSIVSKEIENIILNS